MPRMAEPAARSRNALLAEIAARLGFVPPFFTPAEAAPEVLENLWRQTLSAYVENPLPAVLKERLFAYLSQFCAVPYCIVCHSCALRPLGLSAGEVLELLETPLPSAAEVERALDRLAGSDPPDGCPEPGTPLFDAVFTAAVVSFLDPGGAEVVRAEVRRVLGRTLYAHLAVFLAYVASCHSWVESHPELSWEADERARRNLGPLLAGEPRLQDFFAGYQERIEGARREGRTDVRELPLRLQRRMALHQAAIRFLAEATAVRPPLPRLLEEIASALGWEVAEVWAAEPGGGTLSRVAAWSAPGAEDRDLEAVSDRLHFARGEGLPGRAWEAGRAVWTDDPAAVSGAERGELLRGTGRRTAIAVPMRVAAEIPGVLVLFTRRAEPRDEGLLELLETLGTQLGAALARASAVEARRQSDARKAAMLEAALDAVVTMDAAGRVQEWNPAAEAMFGYPKEEALGRPVADLIVPPELREGHRRGLERHLATGDSEILGRRVEMPARRADGGELPVELTVVRVPDQDPPAFTAFVRDLTERRRSEQERALLAAIVEASADAVLRTTPEGVITTWNPGAERLYGHTRDEAIGRSVAMLIPSERRAELGRFMSRAVAGETAQFETVRRHRSGRPLDVSVSVSPIRDAAGRVVAVTSTSRDIGERKRAEAEREALVGELQSSMRLSELLLGILGHDLRNPLNAILTASAVLAERLDGSGGREPVARIESSGRRMARLIDQLLDFSRIRLGAGLPLEPRPADLAEVAREVIAEAATAATPSGRVRFAARGDTAGRWDPDRLAQVVSNLVANALAHGGTDDPTVVSVDGSAAGRVVLRVENAGEVPAEVLPSLFEPHSGAGRRGGHSAGAGLGLFIARELVLAHGGTIRHLTPAPGRTAFEVELPRG